VRTPVVKSWRSSALRKLHASSRVASPLARGPRGTVLAPTAAVPAVLVLTVPTRPGCSAALYVLVVLVGYASALALACRATRARGLATAAGAGRTRFTVLRCAGPAHARASGRSAGILAMITRFTRTDPVCFAVQNKFASAQTRQRARCGVIKPNKRVCLPRTRKCSSLTVIRLTSYAL